MKKVLIVSYAFPPVGGGGVQRSVKFVKYLRGFEWEPLVLTVANPSVPLVDLNLTKDIPFGTKIYKAKTLEPSYDSKKKYSSNASSAKMNLSSVIKKILSNILLPDIQVLWWPGLVLKLLSVLKKEKPNCIFVSAPPFSTFLPVVLIGKMFHIPVVLDYRDEWDYLRSQYENLSKSCLAIKLDHYFEKYCIKNCSAFTAASDSYIGNLIHRYNLKEPSKGVCITNGFDERDFESVQKDMDRRDDMINVVFSGTVWKGTSLKNYFCAIGRVLEMMPVVRNKLRIAIYGRIVDSEMDYLKNGVLKDVVEVGGYIEHDNIIGEICNADILLMSIADTPGADRIILGKTFEYMATGKHILALLPAGESERLLRKHYDNTTIVEPGDIDAITNAMLSIITNIDKIRKSISRDISHFSRKELTKTLSDVFNMAAAEKN